MPPGVIADNAGFAFSPDGSRFAFAAGEHATLWDIATGKRLASWRLPVALQDQIAFPTAETLLLFRMETLDAKAPPFGTDRSRYPRVCRVRNLLGSRPLEPIVEKREFRGTIFGIVIPADGRFFVMDGKLSLGEAAYATKAFDSRTGAELWSREARRSTDAGVSCCLDPTGSRLAVGSQSEDGKVHGGILIDTESWREIATVENFPHYLSPRAELRADLQKAPLLGWAISRCPKQDPFVLVGVGAGSSSIVCQFNTTGDLFTWGNSDGTATVCDFSEVRRQLAELGLDW